MRVRQLSCKNSCPIWPMKWSHFNNSHKRMHHGDGNLSMTQPLTRSRLWSPRHRYCVVTEKEILAVLFTLQKFYQYVYSRTVTIQSDHKSVEAIAKKPLHTAPKRLQGILLLKTQRYDINIIILCYPGPEMYLADNLNRAYQSNSDSPQ